MNGSRLNVRPALRLDIFGTCIAISEIGLLRSPHIMLAKGR